MANGIYFIVIITMTPLYNGKLTHYEPINKIRVAHDIELWSPEAYMLKLQIWQSSSLRTVWGWVKIKSRMYIIHGPFNLIWNCSWLQTEDFRPKYGRIFLVSAEKIYKPGLIMASVRYCKVYRFLTLVELISASLLSLFFSTLFSLNLKVF